jgi:hypothetical protein
MEMRLQISLGRRGSVTSLDAAGNVVKGTPQLGFTVNLGWGTRRHAGMVRRRQH